MTYTTQKQVREDSVSIGMALAKKMFAKRDNHSEIHLSRMELAAALALAAETAIESLAQRVTL